MSGQDPRNLSRVYELVCEIDEFNSNEDIPRSDWNEIVDLVMYDYKFQAVSLGESRSAARTLAEYLHAKRKHVELSDKSASNNPGDNPLTEEEIELFKEKFNEDF